VSDYKSLFNFDFNFDGGLIAEYQNYGKPPTRAGQLSYTCLNAGVYICISLNGIVYYDIERARYWYKV